MRRVFGWVLVVFFGIFTIGHGGLLVGDFIYLPENTFRNLLYLLFDAGMLILAVWLIKSRKRVAR